MQTKLSNKEKIKKRIRKKIAGTAQKPRLSVFRSNYQIYGQLINDDLGVTLCAISTQDKTLISEKMTKVEAAKLAGKALAQKAKDLGIKAIVFDRGGNLYHGRVKAFADGAREEGLEF